MLKKITRILTLILIVLTFLTTNFSFVQAAKPSFEMYQKAKIEIKPKVIINEQTIEWWKNSNLNDDDDDNDDDDYFDYDEEDQDRGDKVSDCNGRRYPKDVDHHWSEIFVRRLYDLCVTEGYKDNKFKPDQKVSRAEFVKMALYSRGIDPYNCHDDDCGTPFDDIEDWENQWIRAAWEENIIDGYSKNRFYPERDITRAEAVKVILATYDYKPSNARSSFKDVQGWSTGWIEKAHQLGIVQGIGNDKFDPNRSITRAEAAKITVLTLEYWDTRIR